MTQLANALTPSAVFLGVEIPATVTSNFPIPPGALFVDINNAGANDANNGSPSSPLYSVVAAVARVPIGGTVIVRGSGGNPGVYRETLGTINKKVTIQAYPGEEVWLSGSQVISNWSLYRTGVWVASNWNPPLNRTHAPFAQNGDKAPYAYPNELINKSNPYAGNPDRVYINGFPLLPTGAVPAANTGMFYYDAAAQKMYLSIDPTGSLIEGVYQSRCINFGSSADGSAIKGIGVVHYGSTYNFPINAAIMSSASSLTVDSCTFAFNSSTGLGIYDVGAVVHNNVFINNGCKGINMNTASNGVLSGNRLCYNNYFHFDITPTAFGSIASIKATNSTNVKFTNNEFVFNDCNGLWLDLSMVGCLIANNTSAGNSGQGIQVECSDTATVVGNISAFNGRDGIKVSAVTNSDFWHNTLVGNGWSQIGMYEDSRKNPNPPPTWDSQNNTIFNNVMVVFGSNKCPLSVMDNTVGTKRAAQIQISSNNYNFYGRVNANSPVNLIDWMQPSGSSPYTTLAKYVKAWTPRELNSAELNGMTLDAIFTDFSNGDYTLNLGTLAHFYGAKIVKPTIALGLGVNNNTAYLIGQINAPRV